MSKLAALAGELGAGALLTSETDLLSYAYDGALDRGRPDAVALAVDPEDARRVVAWCAARGVPFIARGAGTNLSGGCIALRGGVVLSLARLNRVRAIDAAAGEAVAEPGVVNLALQKELERVGRFYAPDPASFRVCTLGGNVGENAGGPRCLKYGVTSNHIRGLDAVMPDGSLERFSVDDPGPDLVGLLVGAEGTLGVVTRIRARTLPLPERIVTILAGFPSIEASIACVADIVAAGVLPRVLEAMDRVTVESVEAYCHAGYPRTEAVLLIELDGDARRIAAEAPEVERLCRAHGCSEYRHATDLAQRERLWEGRRGAYAAVARIAPNVLVEDGVVPRGALPEVLRRMRKIADAHGALMPLLFHAGDGNIHPNMAYDERDADQTRRVKAAGAEILQACVDLGGSISGEHGIGLDKREAMGWLFSAETLALFRRVKAALDPQGLANPGKLFPEAATTRPDGKPGGGAPRPAPSAAQRDFVARLRERFLRKEAVSLAGTGTKLPEAARRAALTETAGLRAILELDRANYTVTVEAGRTLASLKEELAAEGLLVPVADAPGTLGGLFACKAAEGLRDNVLGVKALLPNGDVVEFGGKVVKNVAGYDVPKVLFGSWGAYAVLLELTLKLYPLAMREAPALAYASRPAAPSAASRPFVPNRWHRKLKAAFDPENRLNPWVFGSGA